MDLAPWPVIWPERVQAGFARELARARFYLMAGVIYALAHEREIVIRWGGNWDGDADLDDQTFFDLVHFELMETA